MEKKYSMQTIAVAAIFLGAIAAGVLGPSLYREHKAKQLVAGDLIDPSSAQFRSIGSNKWANTWVVCGEINGRNKYGGYVGFRRFYVDNGDRMIEPDPADNDSGAEAMRSVFDIMWKRCSPI